MELLEERLTGPAGTNEVVVIEADSLTVDRPAFRELVEKITGDLAALGPEVVRLETLTNYYRSGMPSLVSEDRSAAIIPFVMAGDFNAAADNIREVVDTVKASDGTPGFRVLITGPGHRQLGDTRVGPAGLGKRRGVRRPYSPDHTGSHFGSGGCRFRSVGVSWICHRGGVGGRRLGRTGLRNVFLRPQCHHHDRTGSGH